MSALGLHKLGSGRVAERKRKFGRGKYSVGGAKKMAIFVFSHTKAACVCGRVFLFFCVDAFAMAFLGL